MIDYYNDDDDNDNDTRAAPDQVQVPLSPPVGMAPAAFRSRPLLFPRFVDLSDEDTSDGSNDDHDEWRLERRMLHREPIVIQPRTRPAAWKQRR